MKSVKVKSYIHLEEKLYPQKDGAVTIPAGGKTHYMDRTAGTNGRRNGSDDHQDSGQHQAKNPNHQ